MVTERSESLDVMCPSDTQQQMRMYHIHKQRSLGLICEQPCSAWEVWQRFCACVVWALAVLTSICTSQAGAVTLIIYWGSWEGRCANTTAHIHGDLMAKSGHCCHSGTHVGHTGRKWGINALLLPSTWWRLSDWSAGFGFSINGNIHSSFEVCQVKRAVLSKNKRRYCDLTSPRRAGLCASSGRRLWDIPSPHRGKSHSRLCF